MSLQQPVSASPTSGSSANIVGVHYRVGRKIGEGSFGVIFEGTNLLNSQTVAIKFEPRKSDAPQLRDEYRSYKILAGSTGIPNVHYFGQENLHNILVIDLLGPSLEDLFDMCNRKFSIKTVAMVAKQMISRVETIHEKNLIYRDIKPDNFLIGRPGSPGANLVHVVDFGMAKQYRDPKSKQHIPYRERKSLSGTARYMSINTHLGREQSRRDDLQALGHVFYYFLRGSLPWQGLRAATNKQKYEKIGEKKQEVTEETLGEGFPKAFVLYLKYVRKLSFEESPDYNFLKTLFDGVLKSNAIAEDGVYDWDLLNDGRGWEYSSGRNWAANTANQSATQQQRTDREKEKSRSRLDRSQMKPSNTTGWEDREDTGERERDRDRARERERERERDYTRDQSDRDERARQALRSSQQPMVPASALPLDNQHPYNDPASAVGVAPASALRSPTQAYSSAARNRGDFFAPNPSTVPMDSDPNYANNPNEAKIANPSPYNAQANTLPPLHEDQIHRPWYRFCC